MGTPSPSKTVRPVPVISVVLYHVTGSQGHVNVNPMWRVQIVTGASLTPLDLIAVLVVKTVTVVLHQ